MQKNRKKTWQWSKTKCEKWLDGSADFWFHIFGVAPLVVQLTEQQIQIKCL